MDSMMSIRNRILMNTPHLETASGSIASFKTDVPAKLKECKVYFEPRQEGSGTPSPDNVRNVVGWDGVTVNVNGTDVTVDFPTTVYGGYVDLVSGELVAEWVQIPSVARNYDSRSGDVAIFRMIVDGGANVYTDVKSNMFSRSITGNTVGAMVFYSYMEHGIWVKVPSNEITANTTAACQAWLDSHGTVFIGKLTTPIRYSLTPQQIKTVRGMNHIYTEANNLNITYWSHGGVTEEYQRYDYLLTSGHNARIDTGVPGNDTTLQFEGEIENLEYTAYQYYFGNVDYEMSSQNKQWRLIQPSSTSASWISWGTYMHNNTGLGVPSTLWQSPFRMKFLLRYGYIETTIDGVVRTKTETRDDGYAESTINIAIGSSRPEATSTSNARNRIYYFKIWSHDKVIRDYIPVVRKSDNKAGFYDLINHTFNPSIGSVDFTAGNVE